MTGDTVIQLPSLAPKSEEVGHPRGGVTRRVPLVMTPLGPMACIWKSHEVVLADVNGDGHPIPANECVLLHTRNPLVTLRAEIDVHAWDSFGTTTVEW